MFHIFAASHYSYSVIYNVLRCPSVCLSVCLSVRRVRVLCRNE